MWVSGCVSHVMTPQAVLSHFGLRRHARTHTQAEPGLCWSTEVTGASFPAPGGAFIAGLSVTAQ